MKSLPGSRKLLATSAFACLAMANLLAQQAGRKSFTFHGKVEAVDLAARRLTITNEPIEGWMGTMTMGYTVDNQNVLNQAKLGDRVTAKVYEGDFR
jgi:Cu/Ag efflux protein CusF